MTSTDTLTNTGPAGAVDDTFVAVVTIPVKDAAAQAALIDLLARDNDAWVNRLPGFLSATYHASDDGRTVLNYARWTSEKAYLDGFRGDPRSARLREEIVRRSDGGPSMTAYRIAATIAPAS